MNTYIQDKLDEFDKLRDKDGYNSDDGFDFVYDGHDMARVRKWIEKAFTDYHNHIVERAEEDLKLLKKVHKIELDTIALKSIDELVKWSEHRKQFLQDTNPKE